MGLARVTTWNPGDTLTAAALNGEFNNVLNNPISLVSPTTGAINFQTSVAHTNLAPSAIAATSGGGLPANMSRVRGLIGTVTSSQTVTLSADFYLLQTSQNSSGGGFPTVFPLLSTASFTVNVGTAGPAANGRDVAAAFSSTFVHVYAISTGAGSTTPAGVASSTPPPTGPVLPTSYNSWTYLGTYPYSSASTTFTAGQRPRGAWVDYEAGQAALSAGAATSETSVSLVTLIPSNALQGKTELIYNNSVASNAALRVVSGVNYSAAESNTTAVNTRYSVIFPNVSQTLLYTNNASSGATTLFIQGYSIPNGGE